MVKNIRPMTVVILLAACTTLMMTGHSMPYPVLAPWLIAHNIGMGALGWMSFAFSLGNLIAAPGAGYLVDRWGRRPVLIIGLLAIVIVNLVTPFVDDLTTFIVLRFVLGFGNAGIMPAALAATADIAPEDRRAQWIGYVSGGISIGLIIGPTIGGVLYDALGFAAPFYVSGVMALVAVVLVIFIVPETRPALVPTPTDGPSRSGFGDIWRNPPRPLGVLVTLLMVEFVWTFAWVSTEPAMLRQLYEQYAYTATMFGVIVGVYGAATALGEFGFGGLSDRFGRFVMIAIGLGLNIAWYIGVDQLPQFGWLIVASIVAGIGAGLITPAIGASYADISAIDQRGRIAALKGMVLSLGGMLGPLFAAFTTDVLPPAYFFRGATAIILLASGLAVVMVWRYGRHLTSVVSVPPIVES
jgi:multidrug resistance protein